MELLEDDQGLECDPECLLMVIDLHADRKSRKVAQNNPYLTLPFLLFFPFIQTFLIRKTYSENKIKI